MYTLLKCDTIERAFEKYPSTLAYSRDAGYRGTFSVKFTHKNINHTLHYFSEKIQDIWLFYRNTGLLSIPYWSYNFCHMAKGFEILTWTSENMDSNCKKYI